MSWRALPLLAILALPLAGCSGLAQRTLTGGIVGAAGGVALTALTGGTNLAAGALIGAAGGATVGAIVK